MINLTIDERELQNYNLNLGEFLTLYATSKDINLKEAHNSLIRKNLASEDLYSVGKLIISNNVKDLVSTIIINSCKSKDFKDNDFVALAEQLKECYPTGRKPGTTYSWRGSTADIAKRLKTLNVKYSCNFTTEQAVEATKSYVQSFNGDYTKMRLLKYFVLKASRDADNNVNILSDMMEIIENQGQIDIDNDWTNSIV